MVVAGKAATMVGKATTTNKARLTMGAMMRGKMKKTRAITVTMKDGEVGVTCEMAAMIRSSGHGGV